MAMNSKVYTTIAIAQDSAVPDVNAPFKALAYDKLQLELSRVALASRRPKMDLDLCPGLCDMTRSLAA